MTFHSSPVESLPQAIYCRLHGLNWGPYGEMQEVFEQSRRHERSGSLAYWIKEGSIIIGWALLFISKPEDLHKDMSSLNVLTGYYYIRTSYRRKGYGTALYNHVVSIHGRHQTSSHDERSKTFFLQQGLIHESLQPSPQDQ